MGKIINIQDYFNKKDTEIMSYSIIDMILDPEKRKEVYDYYDSHYVESEEEKKIFEESRGNRFKDSEEDKLET